MAIALSSQVYDLIRKLNSSTTQLVNAAICSVLAKEYMLFSDCATNHSQSKSFTSQFLNFGMLRKANHLDQTAVEEHSIENQHMHPKHSLL